MNFNIEKIRSDFPGLSTKMNGQSLVFLDNASTTQKPRSVIQATTRAYESLSANVHRGAYELSQKSTEAYEKVRAQVRDFIQADSEKEVVFTRGTTESLNLLATSLATSPDFISIRPGDAVLVTRMEHHSNFVPWQILAKRTGARFRIIELTSEGRIDEEDLKRALREPGGRPRVLAMTQMSNVLGTLNPVAEIARLAKDAGALVVVDAAQSIPQRGLNLRALDAVDFAAFSSHKMCGPTGVGVLWGRGSLLSRMSPYQFGGSMISSVQDQDTQWNEIPWKFEAGTPNIAGVIGFGAALEYLNSVGMDAIQSHDNHLTQLAISKLQAIEGVRILGPESYENRGATLSFTVQGVHPHDLATFLDARGIAIRAGHHCAQPLMRHFKEAATARASFSFYNTDSEIEALAQGVSEARTYFSREIRR